MKNTLIKNSLYGYSFNIPSQKIKINNINEIFCSKYIFKDVILTTSYENKNPYFEKKEKGWDIYFNEWLVRYIGNDNYLAANNIKKIQENIIKKEKGFTYCLYSFYIDDSENIKYPYYNIAIIRKNNDFINFYLFVMKSKTNRLKDFSYIIESFKTIKKVDSVETPIIIKRKIAKLDFNEETLRYYKKLAQQNTIDWGIFERCIVSEKDGSYDYLNNYYIENHNKFDNKMNHNFELLPTYMHISWNGKFNYFPLNMANKYAGGNGYNGKKALHFTLQFTTDNNSSGACYTPTFDIMRGKYDEYFHQLAKDIKEYKHPVLFRLNNEMNTDWTSYSGIMALLDPDIFINNYKRLFDIFKEEKVDNCIWIFNPIAITTPYSNWGEFINYYPTNMVHLIGLTFYERGNKVKYDSFNDMYSKLLTQYNNYFGGFSYIISEFGAGCGGEVTLNYEMHRYDQEIIRRNANNQAKWVKDMFVSLKENKLFKDIKAAIWFSCNDYAYVDGQRKIMNYFAIDDSLPDTINAFKQGLNK